MVQLANLEQMIKICEITHGSVDQYYIDLQKTKKQTQQLRVQNTIIVGRKDENEQWIQNKSVYSQWLTVRGKAILLAPRRQQTVHRVFWANGHTFCYLKEGFWSFSYIRLLRSIHVYVYSRWYIPVHEEQVIYT